MPLPIKKDDNWSKTAVVMSTVTLRWVEKSKLRQCYWCCDVIFLFWMRREFETGRAHPSLDWAAEATRAWCNLVLFLFPQDALPSGPSPTQLLLQRCLSQILLSHEDPEPLSDGTRRHTSRSRQARVPLPLGGVATHIQTRQAHSSPVVLNGELFRWGEKSGLFANAPANSLKHQRLSAVSAGGSRPAKQSAALTQPCAAAAEHRCANTISWGTFSACRTLQCWNLLSCRNWETFLCFVAVPRDACRTLSLTFPCPKRVSSWIKQTLKPQVLPGESEKDVMVHHLLRGSLPLLKGLLSLVPDARVNHGIWPSQMGEDD